MCADIDRNNTRKHWPEIKKRVLSRWKEVSETDLESAKGSLEQLAPVLQKTFGWTKEHAEREFNAFKADLPNFLGSDMKKDFERKDG